MISAAFTIFTILSELRRGAPPERIWQTFHRFGGCLTPRLPFWLHLCRQAGFLNASAPYRTTQYFKSWLALPPEIQTLELLEAWRAMPRNPKDRIARRALLRRLEQGTTLKTRDQRELPALQALGIYRDGKLTAWGETILMDKTAPSSHPPAPWYLEANQLRIPFPPDWPLLWELEKFLQPCTPGVYSLQPSGLRRAAQRGASVFGMDDWEASFIHILETGLGKPAPPELRAAILGQPVLRVTHGVILEFSSPGEFKQLRRSPVLRAYFDRILSPRHICVETQNAPRLLKLLGQRGIYTLSLLEDEEETDIPKRRTYFHHHPIPSSSTGNISTTDLLAEYQRLQLALDILYHAPGGVRPEPRRITPLLTEERGGQVYITAYCHTRRAQRTFRLDRIEIPGEQSP